MCCGLTYILLRSHVLEIKDFPQQLGQNEYSESSKTLALILSICRLIFGSGKAVFLDSGICVSKDITDIKAKCVYTGDLIKKRCYWPKIVPRDLIDTHLEIRRPVMLEYLSKEPKIISRS